MDTCNDMRAPARSLGQSDRGQGGGKDGGSLPEQVQARGPWGGAQGRPSEPHARMECHAVRGRALLPREELPGRPADR